MSIIYSKQFCVWSTFFLLNVFSAPKGTQFYIFSYTVVEGFYYLRSENKGAVFFFFAYTKIRFSHDAAHLSPFSSGLQC